MRVLIESAGSRPKRSLFLRKSGTTTAAGGFDFGFGSVAGVPADCFEEAEAGEAAIGGWPRPYIRWFSARLAATSRGRLLRSPSLPKTMYSGGGGGAAAAAATIRVAYFGLNAPPGPVRGRS
jgi:hypothetical protein